MTRRKGRRGWLLEEEGKEGSGEGTLGSWTQQDDTGGRKESSVSVDVGLEKWMDTANQECKGTGTRVSVPKDPRTSPKESQQPALSKAVRYPPTKGIRSDSQ